MLTTVVNLYKEPFDVYCGRAGKGQDGFFGNPIQEGTQEEKIAKFKEYFDKRIIDDAEYRRRVIALRGKRLGCFCKPKICHCDIIADFLNGTHVAVIGSRTFNDYPKLVETLSKYNITMIVSGGAIGADSLGKIYADEHKIPTIIHLPQWKVYGKSAGHIRNKLIVNDADEVVAFWNNTSSGTKGSIDYARKINKPVKVVSYFEPFSQPVTVQDNRDSSFQDDVGSLLG